MAESAIHEEPRVAEAVARLLSRQATLLARSLDDEAAAGAARLGLSWLADLLRSFGLSGASDWFQALRVRADVLGRSHERRVGRARRPAVRGARGRTAQRRIARAARRRSARLAGPRRGTDRVRRAAAARRVPRPRRPSRSRPPPPAAAAGRAARARRRPRPPRPRTTKPACALFEAIADLAGEAMPEVDAQHGRIEISGEQPGRGGDARRRGARARSTRRRGPRARCWSRPRASTGCAGSCACRSAARRTTSSSSAAARGSRCRGAGSSNTGSPRAARMRASSSARGSSARNSRSTGWSARARARRFPTSPRSASGGAAPAGFVLLGRVADAEGRLARVLDLAPAAPSRFVRRARAAPEPAAEAVQPVAVPADNLPESPPSRAGPACARWWRTIR